ncbi:lipid-binding protein [Marinobacter salinexigens]|uniref:Lipid-binding protein n=1 Tax=Marinobacter salinexigens TaxID=2919747 RepID=A0A5B0VBW0_9GAMM|nr:START domain-containing protein [Marinobacter salinexigens]KAA1172052.1 lipid-binding protein [Marinobacter salinexigens]
MRNPGAHCLAGRNSAFGGGICATVLIVVLAILAAANAKAELPAENADGWELRKEDGNIRVYTIEQQDSSFKAFKAVAVLDTPLETLMAVMINPRSCVEWVLNCSESYAFGKGNFSDRYAYSVNDMPWPVTDRDYVLHIRTQGNRASGVVIMELNATPNQRAESSNRVRVDRSDTLYRFEAKGEKTRMVWIQHTDPNGALPGWLVNSLLIDIPIKSIQSLERVAKEDQYQGFGLVYDESGTLIDVQPSDS